MPNDKSSERIGRVTAAAPAARRRRRRARLWWRLALLLVLVAVAVAAWRIWRGGTSQAPTYLTATVERSDIQDAIMAIGTLQPRDYVDVGTQVSGQLKAIRVAIGDHVEQGELLAEIDPTIYQTRVEASQAQLLGLKAQKAEQQARLVLARQQLQRQTALKAGVATSQAALQSAQADAAVAQAQLDAIEAQIELTQSTLRADQANLGYTKIYAPMTGTVVSEDARQGQTLNASQQAPTILRIADLSTMTVWTQVSEADVSRLTIGMPVYFTTLGRPDKRWTGTLREILPTPDVVNNVVLYNALFDVANPDGALLTQMTAQVFFVRKAAKDVLVVPLTALKRTPDGKGWSVEVLKPDGTVEQRAVEVGVTNRVSAEITSGLKQGERVIVGTAMPGSGGAGAMRVPRLS